MTCVRDVRIDVLEVPFRSPVVAGGHRWAVRRLALVRLIADDGLEGIGEVAAAEPGGLPAAIPDDLARRFAGLDPADPADLDERLRAVERRPGIGRVLRSALETAAVDLLARAAGRSVAACLAAGVRARVPLNGLVGIDTPEATVSAAAALTGAGFGCLKLKVGREPPSRLAERVGAVRATVGPKIRLRLDVNGGWSAKEAIEAIEAVARFDLEYVEQPMPPELGPGALAALRRAVPVPLAADESVTDPRAALALLEAGAVDVLVVKPARVGGLRQARRIADLAADSGVPIVVSTLFETGVGVAAALHFAATLGDDGKAHGLATAGLLASDLLTEPLSIVGGWMSLPSGPGLGVRLDPVAVQTFQGAMSRVVRDWLIEWAAARPDAEAVADAGTRWTYAKLEAVTRRVAAALHAEGLGEGSRVAMLLGDGAAAVVLFHAVRRLGAVLVPLNRRAAPAELAFQLAAAAGAVLVHDPERAGLARAALADRPTVRLLGIAQLLAGAADDGPGPEDFRDEVDLDAPATILFTSGTTGRPKGAVLTHRCHVASADAWAAFLGPRPRDRWLACLPLFHVAGLAMVVRASRWGLPLEVHERFDPRAVDRAIESGVSHLSLVAPTLERLLEVRADRPVPPKLRAVLLGGGPIPPALVTRALERGFPVVPTYGLTETASGVAALAPQSAAERSAAAGRPLPGVELRIEVEGRPSRPGEVGEIVVRGPMVFAGYAGLPDETAHVLRDGWLYTGDLGALDGDGYLTVVERRDDLFVSGGESVYPAEVEAVLLTHPAVAEAVVVGRPDPRWGAVPVAAVVLRPGSEVDYLVLAVHCRARLASFKVPVAFHRLAAVPRTPGGKLLRREIRELFAGEAT